jgi:hypothetical protein
MASGSHSTRSCWRSGWRSGDGGRPRPDRLRQPPNTALACGHGFGCQQPIGTSGHEWDDGWGSSWFKGGSTVPVKFQLWNDSGQKGFAMGNYLRVNVTLDDGQTYSVNLSLR